MSDLFNVPRVGISVLVERGSKLLLGLREGGLCPGTWCPPGGHLERREGVAGCVCRETLEETGLKVRYARLLDVSEDFYLQENKHYITLFVTCDDLAPDIEPQILEPLKCKEWGWFSPRDFPEPLFPAFGSFVAGASLLAQGPKHFSIFLKD